VAMATRAAINHTGVSFRLPLHHHLHQELQKLGKKKLLFQTKFVFQNE